MDRLQRLAPSTVDSLCSSVIRSSYSRNQAAVGQVHLGAGAFMRAHIAVYNDDVMNRFAGNWGIAGVSLRRPDVKEQLGPQSGLYTVAVCNHDKERYRLVESLKSIDVAPDDPLKIIRMIADPAVQIVSLTVTEKGYSIEPESGALDTKSADIVHDSAELLKPRSTLGLLAAGLRMRQANGAGPITIMSCDNLPHNGARLRQALGEFIDITTPDLSDWVDTHVRFPGTMVDRIVPATTTVDRDRAATAIGVFDAGLVRTEPFTQWVIEDNFAGSRPAWESAGALLVQNVEPYELAKLRLLNGAHSALAYLGYLGGYEFIHDVMGNAQYVAYVRHMMIHEISPVTPQPEGMRHAYYIDTLLTRFGNAALRHRTWQIAMDGSQKLPQRQLNTIRAQLRKGGPIAGLSLAVAAWIRYTLGRDEHGSTIDVSDPLAERFAEIARLSGDDPEEIVGHYVGIPEIFGDDLPSQPRFTSTVAGQLRSLLERGAVQTVTDFADGCGQP